MWLWFRPITPKRTGFSPTRPAFDNVLTPFLGYSWRSQKGVPRVDSRRGGLTTNEAPWLTGRITHRGPHMPSNSSRGGDRLSRRQALLRSARLGGAAAAGLTLPTRLPTAV